MIRTNLATRPFYNERPVHAALAVLAALAIVITLFNVTSLIRSSRTDTRFGAQAARDEASARDLQAEAARLRATVDAHAVENASEAARLANDLIDRRTFSWTELFNRFEATLPDQVRITAVRPQVDVANGTRLTINVIAADTDDVAQFMEKLEATGAFKDLRGTSQERINEQGMLEATLETRYVPGGAAPTAGAGGARR
ncbi:MAG: PilN domain-containing protein [Acidobacteria bacterium]|nr:PilN domain-containing protein [Acidobacteriota bacterium]